MKASRPQRQRGQGKIDLVDAASAAVMVAASLFVLTFFWQAAAGAAGGEESFLARLHREAEKRIMKERTQITFLLKKEEEGQAQEALEEGLAAYSRLGGNSQFHLLLGRGYREKGQLGDSVREYRRALEANRDYTDSRSPFYLGDTLRLLVSEGRALYLAAGRPRSPSPADKAVVRDLFYLERSLAGGCH